jgi:hypothetical protein
VLSDSHRGLFSFTHLAVGSKCEMSWDTVNWRTLQHIVQCSTEPVLVVLLRSPGIDSQTAGSVRQPYLSYPPTRLYRLAESIPRNRFLGSIKIFTNTGSRYKYKNRSLHWSSLKNSTEKYSRVPYSFLVTSFAEMLKTNLPLVNFTLAEREV